MSGPQSSCDRGTGGPTSLPLQEQDIGLQLHSHLLTLLTVLVKYIGQTKFLLKLDSIKHCLVKVLKYVRVQYISFLKNYWSAG